jgi:hypothetical protein
MIFPVADTLKRFLALEFVFTLGILPSINNYTLEAFPTGGSLSNLFRKYPPFAEAQDKERTSFDSAQDFGLQR